MFKKSTRKDKRLMLVLPDKTIHFGSPKGFTYIDGASEIKKQNYLKRHSVNEDWTTVNAGSLSRYILWNHRDIRKNIKQYLKYFISINAN